MASLLLNTRPEFNQHKSFDEPLLDLAGGSPSASDSDDSEYLADSTPGSPGEHSIDNPSEQAPGERTTIQGKDWRGASHIHKKSFWQVSSPALTIDPRLWIGSLTCHPLFAYSANGLRRLCRLR